MSKSDGLRPTTALKQVLTKMKFNADVSLDKQKMVQTKLKKSMSSVNFNGSIP